MGNIKSGPFWNRPCPQKWIGIAPQNRVFAVYGYRTFRQRSGGPSAIGSGVLSVLAPFWDVLSSDWRKFPFFNEIRSVFGPVIDRKWNYNHPEMRFSVLIPKPPWGRPMVLYF